MNRYILYLNALAALLLLCGSARAGNITIPLVPVGDAGNVADSATGYGAVSYAYDIGQYDVTMGQYTAFLNSVATTADPYGLYNASMATATPTYGITRTSASGSFSYTVKGNSANVPVDYVSWGDAARFVNWLQNGQPNGAEGPGTTENGTYAINGGTTDAQLMTVSRSGTGIWVLPTVNEWYKAAYYKGGGTNAGYWTYANQSNSIPSNVLSATGTNNANYTAITSTPPFAVQTDPTNELTLVGAFQGSSSTYGTFDQSGDVTEWEETSLNGSYHEIRGGSFAGGYFDLSSAADGGGPPTSADVSVGFRVAYVPEPNSAMIVFAASAITCAIIVIRRLTLRHWRKAERVAIGKR